MNGPVVVIAGRYRPHELCLLALSVYIGVLDLVAPPKGSPVTLLPAVVQYPALAALVVSGVAGLAGCFWRWNPERGLRVEQGALLLGTGALSILYAAIFSVVGWRIGLTSAPTTAAWMAANLWRAGQIHAELRRLRKSAEP